MAVGEGNQSPVLREYLVHLICTFGLVRDKAFRAGELLGRGLEEEEKAVSAERVAAGEHPGYTLLLVPFV